MNRVVCLFLFVACGAASQEAFTPREKLLLDRIELLERRLAALEAQLGNPSQAPLVATTSHGTEPVTPPPATTVNVNVDGYYAYNMNQPSTRVNLLRAYDVSGNSFAINQAGLVIERLPDVQAGRRAGARLDLMFGQATETLQGSPANEERPEVFRHLFQAYGTYIAPIGRGLTVDFGKWASSLGIEGNYTKDQFNYSRSYWFNFLPYYHMGLRTTYPITESVNASYWLTNGANQTEDFNAFKSHAFLLNLAPGGNVSANLNYYFGQEQRTVGGLAPRGRTHYVDGYVTWVASPRWTFAAEGDYAIERVTPSSSPKVVMGGAGYGRYRVMRRLYLAGRFAYLHDAGGWFTGTRQALKDATLTATWDMASGFQMRWEVRRDWSDAAIFPSQSPDQSKRQQTTALLGLTYWIGEKQGPW